MEISTKDNGSKLTLSEATFDRPFSEALVHQVVTAYMAGGRSGTKATKTRSEVRGGGRKPWKQKGTGRARAGTIRSPLWRGGGHAMALKPRDHSQKVNRKMYRGAIQAIFSELLRSERLDVVDAFKVDSPKTSEMVKKMADYEGRVLLILNEVDENVFRGARNLSNLAVIDTAAIDPVTLVSADHVIVTADAVKSIEEWLG